VGLVWLEAERGGKGWNGIPGDQAIYSMCTNQYKEMPNISFSGCFFFSVLNFYLSLRLDLRKRTALVLCEAVTLFSFPCRFCLSNGACTSGLTVEAECRHSISHPMREYEPLD
jgi:hypothetical protein